MKFLSTIALFMVVGVATQAEVIYRCDIEKVHNGDYENVHDFLFEEYPTLTIEMSESGKFSISIGAITYDEADDVLVDVAKIGYGDKWGIFYDEQMTERIDFFTSGDNSMKTKANLRAFLDETEGLKLIATFNCD